VFVNNERAENDTLVYENFHIKLTEIGTETDYASLAGDDENDAAEGTSESESTKDAESGNAEKPADGKTSEAVPEDAVNITIMINGKPLTLSGKKDYILVDLFQFYDFDLSKPQGNVVFNQNGQPGEYTAPLNNGDVIDLYWEK
jgi:hypothetical protein